MTMINPQGTANLYNEVYKPFGMLVNIKKTDRHPGGPGTRDSGRQHQHRRTTSGGHRLISLPLLLNNVTHERDLDKRIREFHIAYGKLSHRVLGNHGLTIKLKIMLSQPVVLSTLLYSFEA